MLIPILFAIAQSAYVTTSGGVAVIDTGSGKTVATLALGAGNAAVNALGTRVYATQTAAKNVVAIDTATNAVVATIAVGNGAAVAAVSPDGTSVYVSNESDNTVSAISTATNAVVATIPVGARPFGVAVSVDGSKVYVCNSSGNSVSVIETATNAVSGTIALPFPAAPYLVAFSVDGQKAYVTDNGNGHVYAIATATDTVSGAFQPGIYNQGVAFSPNGAQAYVTDAEGTVAVVDAVADRVTATIPLGGSPAGVAFSPDGTKAFIANGALNEVQIVNTGSLAVTSVATPAQPTGFGMFIQAGGPPSVAAVGNGFTFLAGASPGAFIAITGVNLASETMSFAGGTLPTSIGETEVLLDGFPIPLYYVSPTQINAQVPTNTAVSLSSLDVMNGTEMSNRVSIVVDEAAPGIPYYVLNGASHASARNEDNSINSPSNPARAGSVMTIYFTGIGPVTNAVAAGVPAPSSPLSNALLPVTVTIGGQTVTPAFAGLSPGSIGLAQANVMVPALATGDYPVVISIAGALSNAPVVSVSQ